MPRPMRSFAAFATAIALGLSSAFLVACGDRNNLIPQSSASEMKGDLDEAARAVAGGHCSIAQRAIDRAATSANELPSSVDSALRRNLAENFKVVGQRVATNCQQTTTPTTTQATTPTATSTQATTVETVPTETTTTPAPTTNPTTTPSSGGRGSGGAGSGSGGTGSGSGGSSGGNGNGGGLKPPTD